MKKIAFLPLIASLMLLSGCVNLPGAEISDVGLLGLGEPEYTIPEEISVAVQAVPGNVRPGRRMEAFFDIDNTGNTTLENVRLDDVDNCVFNLQEKEGIDGTNLEPLDKKSPTWTFEAPENVTMDKRCDMRYRVSYDSTAHALFNVRALSEDEYITREKAGDLAGLSDVRYEKTRTPVEIMAEVSEEQPMIEGESFLVHFHIENKGDGFVDEDGFKPGDIRLSFPGDILDLYGCQEMEVDPNNGENNEIIFKDIDFRNGRTAKTSCRFSIDEEIDTSETGTFRMSVDYRYVNDGLFEVSIVP